MAERIMVPTFEEAQMRGLEPRCISDQRPPRLLLLRVEMWVMRFWVEARLQGDPLYAAACWLAAHRITHLRLGTGSCLACDASQKRRVTDE